MTTKTTARPISNLLLFVACLGFVLLPVIPRPVVAASSSAQLMRQAEDKLVAAGYMGTLDGAYWALGQGPKIIPVLSEMLNRQAYYRKKYDDAVGAFPFNALWTLAHMKTP